MLVPRNSNIDEEDELYQAQLQIALQESRTMISNRNDLNLYIRCTNNMVAKMDQAEMRREMKDDRTLQQISNILVDQVENQKIQLEVERNEHEKQRSELKKELELQIKKYEAREIEFKNELQNAINRTHLLNLAVLGGVAFCGLGVGMCVQNSHYLIVILCLLVVIWIKYK